MGSLKPEISTSYSFGISGSLFRNLIFSLDAYKILIDTGSLCQASMHGNGMAMETLLTTVPLIAFNAVDPEASLTVFNFLRMLSRTYPGARYRAHGQV